MTPYVSSSIVRKRFGNRIFAFEGDDLELSTNFEVFAVIAHSGMLESEHMTYLRLNEQWYKCDDAWITELEDEVVRASQIYLVFYLQKPNSDHKSGEDGGCHLPQATRLCRLLVVAEIVDVCLVQNKVH
ncbi:putative ubiquitinyl hydrolase 1 [Helianthus anomalus]